MDALSSTSGCAFVDVEAAALRLEMLNLDKTIPAAIALLDQKIEEFCHELFLRRTKRKDEACARFMDDAHVQSICGQINDTNCMFVKEVVTHPYFLGSLSQDEVSFILEGQNNRKGILYIEEEWIPTKLDDSCSPKVLWAELKYTFINSYGFIQHVILKVGEELPSYDQFLEVDPIIQNKAYFKGFGRFNLLRMQATCLQNQALKTRRLAAKIIECCASITRDELDPAPILENLLRKKIPSDRYRDVLPYTMNCVAAGGHDINGSYVRAGNRLFIACQGPTSNVNAFWQTVLHHGTETIIALGPNSERHVEKFDAGYFIFDGTLVLEDGVTVKKVGTDTAIDWDFVVTDLKESPKSVKHSIITRTFEITSPSLGTRTIKHHHCPTWQDMRGGDCRILTELIACIEATPLSPHTPIVVHCSAGVGRTGTLITGFEIHQKLKAHPEQPIALLPTILEQRHARYGMVQNKEQVEMLLNFIKAKQPL